MMTKPAPLRNFALLSLLLQLLASFPCLVLVHGYVTLEPGVGLRSADGSMHVVIFEHTQAHGTGGLVLNQPTPLRLRDLQIPRFTAAFGENSLMLGGGIHVNENGSRQAHQEETNVALTDMAPWFWLHTIPDLPKSTPLEGAKGLLFLGGNIEVATEWIQQGKALPSDFKFLYKYRQWAPGELAEEIDQKGLWTAVEPMQPHEAVQTYHFPNVF